MGQWDKASEYLNTIRRELNAAKAKEQGESWTAYAEEHPLIGALGNVAASFVTPAAWLGNVVQMAKNAVTGTYEPVDTNSGWFEGTRLSAATREGVSTAAALGEEWEIAGKDIGSFLAETGLSIGQFLSKVPLGPLALPYMGAGAAGETTYEALESGASSGQAFLLGTSAGLIEAATEKIGLDNLFRIVNKSGKQGVMAVLSQVLSEASEEAISEVANNLVDLAVMADNSDFRKYVNSLVQSGMSRAQAEAMAFKQFFLVNTMWAAAGGALSGGVTGTGAVTAANVLGNVRQNGVTQTEQPAAEPTSPDTLMQQIVAQGRQAEQERNALTFEPGRGQENVSDAQKVTAPAEQTAPKIASEGEIGQGNTNTGVVRDANFKKANLSSKTIRTLDAVAKVAGVEVRFAPEVSESGMKGNAKYENGVITIALDAQDPVRTAFTHEVVHRIKEASPEVYGTLASFVSEHMQQGSLEALGEFYSETYETSDANVYTEEMVADAFGTMLGDSKVLEQFVQDDRNAAQKVLDAIHDFIAAIKRTLNGQNVKLSQEERSIFAELESDLAGMEKALSDALNAIAGNKNTATVGGGAKLSAMRKSGMDFTSNGQYNGFDNENLELRGEPTNKPVDAREWHAFNRSFANQTMGMKRGEERDVVILTDRSAYFVSADGYMRGFAEAKILITDAQRTRIENRKERIHGTDTHGRTFDRWAAAVQSDRGGTGGDLSVSGDRGAAEPNDRLPSGEPRRNGAGNFEEDQGNYYDEEVELVPGNLMYDGNGHAFRVNEHGLLEEIKLSRIVAPEKRAEVAGRMAELNKQYGTIPAGEKPAREVQIPKKTADDKKVSQTVRTVLEARATPEAAIPSIEEMVANGDFSYEVYGDEAAINDANEYIVNRGWGDAQREWFKALEKGEVSKRNTTVGWTLYNNAVNSGDTEAALDILNAMVGHQRNAAQALQATRILKKLSPETQLYAIQKSVDRLQQELNDRYGSKKKGAPKITIDPELAEQLLSAADQKDRDEVMKEIYRSVGRQMPSRFIDKWNAWRYLSMLGNARTHVRNIVGNAAFTPVVTAKNLTATAIESAVHRVSGGRTGRSKSVVTGFTKADRELLSAAWKDYATVEDAAMGGGKYNDSINTNKYIEEGRRVFGKTEQARTAPGRVVSATVGKAVDAARKGNSKLLDVEDKWFSQPHYAAALASYCKANGLTPAQIKNGQGMDKARAYAMKEAQKATYRDTNVLSTAISQMGKYEGKNPVKKGISTVMEGILPFRKTPANILARGLEYSPAGLLKSISWDIYKVKQGTMTATEMIDNLSAGLTGTGLMALGVFLAAQGLIRGHGGSDEKEKEFEELMGHQAYSLEVGDASVTLDWLAPECLPFFIGVNLWENTKGADEEVTMSSLLESIRTVTEPMLEMSCLQSLNDVFDAVGYASSEGMAALPAVAASAATSYLTQGIPTLLGQFERSSQNERMTTYTEKNAFLTKDMQYAIGSASSRIPGFDYGQIAWVDAWGRTENTGTVGDRLFSNMLNPAYTSEIETSEMEEELLRLYEETDEAGVFPSRAAKYFTVNGERLDLSPSQYVAYVKAKGQKAYDMLTELTGSAAYKGLDSVAKVQAVELVYDYANALAKAKVSAYQAEGWIAEAQAAVKTTGISEAQYVTLYLTQKGISSLKDADGETISNSKGLQIMEMIYNAEGLTAKQRQQLFKDFDVGKSIIGYSQSEVQKALKEMRKNAG